MTTESAITDTLERPMRDLRVSVIDACNFRCAYCMPPDNSYRFAAKHELLNPTEIERLVRIFALLGVRKIRITGGEPLLRKELPQIIRQIQDIPDIEDIALSTNGHHLEDRAAELKDAGLERITVSMDAIDANLFAHVSGVKADVGRVLKGVREAVRVGLFPVKLNVVVQRGVNDHALMDMVEFAREEAYIIRFIEYMDVGTLNGWRREHVMPSAEILRTIEERWKLEPASPNYFGEVASRYTFQDGGGELGFISSVTQPFCRRCTRARLSSYGSLYTCLFASEGVDLRGMLRHESSDEDITDVIRNTWQQRTDRYSEERAESGTREDEKVEMYSIGG